MASRYRDNRATPRQRDHSAFRCGFAQVLPDFTTTLTVTDRFTGLEVARSAVLERAQVRDELHRLRELFPFSADYDITASVKERGK